MTFGLIYWWKIPFWLSWKPLSVWCLCISNKQEPTWSCWANRRGCSSILTWGISKTAIKCWGAGRDLHGWYLRVSCGSHVKFSSWSVRSAEILFPRITWCCTELFSRDPCDPLRWYCCGLCGCRLSIMVISVPGVCQLPFHRANVPVCRPFLGDEKWKTLVNPLLSVRWIGMPSESSSKPNSKPQHGQITYVGQPCSSCGGSGKRSYPQMGQINSFLLMMMVFVILFSLSRKYIFYDMVPRDTRDPRWSRQQNRHGSHPAVPVEICRGE